jgi:transcriptional regulator with XRE-family HTH domain
MKTCWRCEGELQVIKDKPYHYKESGLDNIYLYGIIQYKCKECEEGGPEIPSIEKLHLAIGRTLVCKENLLTAPEIKYLRKELGLKSKEMAEVLSVSPQEYSKWENSKDIISPVYDSNLRLTYVLNADHQVGAVLHDGIRFVQQMARSQKVTSKKAKEKPIEISLSEWMGPIKDLFFSEECEARA